MRNICSSAAAMTAARIAVTGLVVLLGMAAGGRHAAAAVCDVNFTLDVTPRNPVDGGVLTYTARFCDTTGFPATVFTTTFGLSDIVFVPFSGEWLSCPTSNCTETNPNGQMRIGRFDLAASSCVTFVFTLQLQVGVRGQTICEQGQASLKSDSPPPAPGTCTRASDDTSTSAVRDATCVTVQDPAPGCTIAPAVTTSIVTACQGTADVLSAAGSTATGCPGGTLTYQWMRSGVDIPGATQATLPLSGEPAGSYQYRVRIACQQLPACESLSSQVQANLMMPQGTFQATPTTACTGQPVTVTIDNVATCSIDCGDGAAPQNVCQRVCTYATAGTYNIVATGDDGLCLASYNQAVSVVSQPQACIGPLQGVCETTSAGPTAVTLPNCSGTGLSYAWTASTGTLSNPSGFSPTLTLPNVATRTPVNLTLSVTSSCGAPHQSQSSFDLLPTPAASAGASPLQVCTGRSVAFTGQAGSSPGPYTYAWTFGDGGTSSQQNPSHSYAAPGSYTATLTATDTSVGCSAPATVGVTVTPGPAASASAAPPGPCPNEDVTFMGQGPAGVTYAWDFGDGNTSTQRNPVHRYANPGLYTATLTVTDPATGCTGVATVPVDVSAMCSPCPPTLPVVGPIHAARQPALGDVTLYWPTVTGAADGYNVWAADLKTDIVNARGPVPPPGVTGICLPVGQQATPVCIHAGATPGASRVLHYQVRALCGGSEGP